MCQMIYVCGILYIHIYYVYMWHTKSPEFISPNISFPSMGTIDAETALHSVQEFQTHIEGGKVIIMSAMGNVGAGHLRQGLGLERFCKLFTIPFSHYVLEVGDSVLAKGYALGQRMGVLGPMERAAKALPMQLFNYSTLGTHRTREMQEILNGHNHTGRTLVCTTHYAAEHTAIRLANAGVFGDNVTLISYIPDPWKDKELAAMRSNLRTDYPHYVVTHNAETAEDYLRITPNADPEKVLPWGTSISPDFTFGFQTQTTEMPSVGVDFAGNAHKGILLWTQQMLSVAKELIRNGQICVDIHTMTHQTQFNQLVQQASVLGLSDYVRICWDPNIISAARGRDQRTLGYSLPSSTTVWGSRPEGRLHALCGKGELPLSRLYTIGPNEAVLGPTVAITVSGEGHEIANAEAGKRIGNLDMRGVPPSVVLNTIVAGVQLDTSNIHFSDNPFMALDYALTH